MQEIENENQMYALHSVISHLGRCDQDPDSARLEDVSQQCLNIVAKMPAIVAYNFQASRFREGKGLSLIPPHPDWSIAENFLYMLKGARPSFEEAQLFDLCLVLHAEHGGGNNSTFAVRTVSSSGANTYMAICSGIASLSGHLHGGANESVVAMMNDIKENVSDWRDEERLTRYLKQILAGECGDQRGKIYGMGHAVYTLSDPRALILREKARTFSRLKGAEAEFELYERVERLAVSILYEVKGKRMCANVDFYSGLVYSLLGIPTQLFTPIFALSRSAGWVAHRLEQLIQDKIIRPAYLSTHTSEKNFPPLDER